MNNTFLVDAETITAFFNGKTELFHLFDDVSKIAVSVVSVSEIYAYSKTAEEAENAFSVSRDFCSQLEIIPVEKEICEKFAELKAEAQKKKLAVSDNKIWVAAAALYYGFILVSEDKVYDSFEGINRKSHSELNFS